MREEDEHFFLFGHSNTLKQGGIKVSRKSAPAGQKSTAGFLMSQRDVTIFSLGALLADKIFDARSLLAIVECELKFLRRDGDEMTRGRRSDGGGTVATSLQIGGDRTVRRLGFGAMRLTSEPSGARERSIAVARRAVELGVNLIDTAFMYGWGQNELLLREALHPYPEDLVVATKIGIIQPGPGKWAADGRPESLQRQAEDSLRRLGIERIGLLQLHRIDPNVPFADQLGALLQLQQSGKAAHIGLSEVSAGDLVFATGTMAIASVQNRYGILDRSSDAVLKICTDMGIAFLPWRPVANSNEAAATMTAEANTLVKTMDSIASELKATRTQIALAWLLHRSPVILPIPGTSNIVHLEENIAALELSLDVAQMNQLSH